MAEEDSDSDDGIQEKNAGLQDKELGFEVAPGAGSFIVSAVRPNSWAARNQLAVGNEVLSMGGKSAKKMTLEEVRAMISPEGARPLRFWLQADVGS
ncbi:unnamed protein product [Effrenium voratum]|nr:unnamed protein product [Effrenium voratum]